MNDVFLSNLHLPWVSGATKQKNKSSAGNTELFNLSLEKIDYDLQNPIWILIKKKKKKIHTFCNMKKDLLFNGYGKWSCSKTEFSMMDIFKDFDLLLTMHLNPTVSN